MDHALITLGKQPLVGCDEPVKVVLDFGEVTKFYFSPIYTSYHNATIEESILSIKNSHDLHSDARLERVEKFAKMAKNPEQVTVLTFGKTILGCMKTPQKVVYILKDPDIRFTQLKEWSPTHDILKSEKLLVVKPVFKECSADDFTKLAALLNGDDAAIQAVPHPTVRSVLQIHKGHFSPRGTVEKRATAGQPAIQPARASLHA